MDSNIESAVVWSTMVNYPLCYYDSHYDAHMCAWNGVVMTRSLAMLIVTGQWMNLFPNTSQKDAVEAEYRRLIKLGALKSDMISENDTYIEITRSLKYKLHNGSKKFFNDLLDKYSSKEAMSWFLPQAEKTFDRVVTQ